MNGARPAMRGRVRYDWWRAHHGLPQHAKWRAVARSAQVPVSVAFHIAICLLDCASRGNPRGSIGDFKPFDCAGIVDVPADKVERVIVVLRDIHWLEGNMIADWDERQPQREDATAAARKAKQRSLVTHAKRDNGVCHASTAGPSVTTADVTKISAPDREKDITSTFSAAARENDETNPAGSLATALPAGALARQPSTKPVSQLTRGELDALIQQRRTSKAQGLSEEGGVSTPVMPDAKPARG